MRRKEVKEVTTFMLRSSGDCPVITLMKDRMGGPFGENAIEGHTTSPAHAWGRCGEVARDKAVMAAVRATPKAFAELISRRDGRGAELEW